MKILVLILRKEENIMKKNFFILNIFFIILLVIAVLIVQNKITTIDNLKKNKENTREISIEPYSNENNSIKILVNVVDTEYGIEKVIYKKCELLNILDGLLQLCDKAECLKADILYEGI